MRTLQYKTKETMMIRSTSWHRKFIQAIALLAFLVTLTNFVPVLAANQSSPIERISYLTDQKFIMGMGSSKDVPIVIHFNKDTILARGSDVISVVFKTATISPQFNILSLHTLSTQSSISKKQLVSSNYSQMFEVRLHANYIGHAILYPVHVQFTDSATKKTTTVQLPEIGHRLAVTIIQYEAIWDKIFFVLVSLLVLIGYINLGAQLDEENMRQVIKKPKTLILGFLISVLVMPTISWFVGLWLLSGQPLYRMGSFIFAICPTASASTLWTVMLKSDKELSVGLQVVSTMGSLLTMPLLLYAFEGSMNLGQEVQQVKIPYSRLIMTLTSLLIALIIGWRLVGRHKKARSISRQIFRPLIFFILIFIIVFSTMLYWYIYQMFDFQITLSSFIIAMVTYLISGLLGYFINCDLDRGVAISITSAYKNSGIAFAVLLVAFDAPDTYIAYVPCLTQVLTTSVTLYIAYTLVTIINYLRRRGQPDVIQASSDEVETTVKREEVEERSDPKRQIPDESGENEEFIAMNVTDIENESFQAAGKAAESSSDQQVMTVKVTDNDKNT